MNDGLVGGWGLPRDASLHGWRVDWLLNATSVFVLIMFAATLAWIIAARLLHGARHRARYDLGSARGQIIKAVLLSALIFVVVDGNLLLSGLADIDDAFWNFRGASADPRAVRIEVNAHQWAWDARYPGADGTFGTPDDIVTLNDIRVPVDVPVIIQLGATDVLHGFSLPNFRVKQDAVPGMVTRLWFQAKETGVFEVACAQHCGVNHYKMRAELTVLPHPAFETWSSEASELALRAYDPDDKTAHWGWDWDRAHR
jgi:cytochrome c oxidase subunit 2